MRAAPPLTLQKPCHQKPNDLNIVQVCQDRRINASPAAVRPSKFCRFGTVGRDRTTAISSWAPESSGIGVSMAEAEVEEGGALRQGPAPSPIAVRRYRAAGCRSGFYFSCSPARAGSQVAGVAAPGTHLSPAADDGNLNDDGLGQFLKLTVALKAPMRATKIQPRMAKVIDASRFTCAMQSDLELGRHLPAEELRRRINVAIFPAQAEASCSRNPGNNGGTPIPISSLKTESGGGGHDLVDWAACRGDRTKPRTAGRVLNQVRSTAFWADPALRCQLTGGADQLGARFLRTLPIPRSCSTGWWLADVAAISPDNVEVSMDGLRCAGDCLSRSARRSQLIKAESGTISAC